MRHPRRWLTALALSWTLTVGAADAPPAPARAFLALSVADAAASATWYARAFDARVLHESAAPDGSARAIVIGSDRLLVELLQHRDARPRAAGTGRHLLHGPFKAGFQVADLEASVARLRAMDAELVTGIVEDAQLGLHYAIVRDNEGNTLQLFGAPPARRLAGSGQSRLRAPQQEGQPATAERE